MFIELDFEDYCKRVLESRPHLSSIKHSPKILLIRQGGPPNILLHKEVEKLL